jgi:hypothetical protein
MQDRAIAPSKQSAAFFFRIALRVIQNHSRSISRKSNFAHRADVTLDDF